MEKLPQHQRNNQPGNGLVLSNTTKAIVAAVAEVNELIVFKMENEAVLHWAQEIERLAPGTDPEKVTFLIDCFKTERLTWDKTKGIQNIFSGLKQIRKTEEGEYKILSWPC